MGALELSYFHLSDFSEIAFEILLNYEKQHVEVMLNNVKMSKNVEKCQKMSKSVKTSKKFKIMPKNVELCGSLAKKC